MPGTVGNIRTGPGWLYYNLNLTAPEPTNLTTPWATVDAGWLAPGYTEEGHEVTYSPSFEGIEVAEEKLPVDYEQASAELSMAFSLAEITAENMAMAWNGGSIVISGAGANQIKTFEPPDINADAIEIKLGWEAFNGKERYVFRRCLQVGDVAIARRKAPNKALIPMSFRCMVPSAGVRPFKHLLSFPA